MKIMCQLAFVGLASFFTLNAVAEELNIEVFSVADGKSIGFIEAIDTPQGILLTPKFQGLPSGLHGMHIHENPSCGNHAMDAGGHWDPQDTRKHLGPYQNGHLGDLPALYVNADTRATLPVFAPHLTVNDLHNHSLMIHAGSDNYSDNPPMGGGGERLACGVISE